MYLIGSIGLDPQSAVTLYIYKVGKTYPARNHVYRSKSIKNSNYSRIPPRPVRPTGQTGRFLPDWPQCLDQSDCSVGPVSANFDRQQFASGLPQRILIPYRSLLNFLPTC